MYKNNKHAAKSSMRQFSYYVNLEKSTSTSSFQEIKLQKNNTCFKSHKKETGRTRTGPPYGDTTSPEPILLCFFTI